MDVISYLLGKNSSGSGGGLPIDVGTAKIKFGNSQFSTLDVNAFDFGNCTNMENMFISCSLLETIPNIDTSNATNMFQMCRNCSRLKSISLLNTANVTNMSQMCNSCPELTTIPLLNTNKVTNMSNIFVSCYKLTDESLDNILQMCINAVSYTGTKTLKQMGISNTTYYPASRIQTLPHYQDFINAGWIIGY